MLHLKLSPTKKSIRTISIPQIVLDLLKSYRAEKNKEKLIWGSLWQSSDRLFTAEDGAPMSPSTPSQWFSKFLKKNNLPKIAFHELRHTGASLMIAQGADISTVSARLGHSKVSTTLDIYTHALDVLDKKVSDNMESLLLGNVDL